jgi:hypothetical protein
MKRFVAVSSGALPAQLKRPTYIVAHASYEAYYLDYLRQLTLPRATH